METFINLITEPFIWGNLIFLYFLFFDSKTIEIKWDAVSRFLAFMSLITFFRISIASFTQGIEHTLPNSNTYGLEPWKFALVFWEDAFFVLPMVILSRFEFTNRWYIWMPAMVGMSYWFGTGHAYQGNIAVWITAIYPYFISYRYGVKFGFGTVMVCHIMYDFITFYTARFTPFLI